MKETKSFFANNNRLNKGYLKLVNSRESDNSFYRKKFGHILPPLNILEEYENLYPGITTKLIEMAEKEQEHRHLMDKTSLESYEKISKMSKICSLIFCSLACLSTVCLILLGHLISASIVVAILAIAIFAGGAFSSYKFTKKREYERR